VRRGGYQGSSSGRVPVRPQSAGATENPAPGIEVCPDCVAASGRCARHTALYGPPPGRNPTTDFQRLFLACIEQERLRIAMRSAADRLRDRSNAHLVSVEDRDFMRRCADRLEAEADRVEFGATL